MKALNRRLARVEETAALKLGPPPDMVTAEDLEYLRALGCDLHGAEAELGKLAWRDYVVRFTTPELERIEAAGRAEEAAP